MSTRKAGYRITSSGNIFIIVDGKTYDIATDFKNYNKVLDAVRTSQWDNIEDLINVGKSITKGTNGLVTVSEGIVFYKGQEVHDALTRRIIELISSDLPYMPSINFMENLWQNTSMSAIKESFNFLQANNLPLTEDGCFIAYKRITEDYKDFWSRTIDNRIGQKPYMDRNLVSDSSVLCGPGFHFCSKEYLKCYHAGEGRIIAMKINPKDVVSIPPDHDGTKGRCNTYEVLMELENDIDKQEVPEAFSSPLYTNEGVDYKKSENYHNQRDANGRFIKKENMSSVEKLSNLYGTKPNGDKFYNLRDAKGHFIKRAY